MPTALFINNQEVLESELLQEWDAIKKKSLPQDVSPEEHKKQEQLSLTLAKENIIQRILLEQEAMKKNSEIPFSAIKQHYEKIVEHFGGVDAFEKKFNATTQSEKKKLHQNTKENVERSLKIAALIDDWVGEWGPLLDSDLEKFYEENRENYVADERVIFSYLLLDWKSAGVENRELFYKCCTTATTYEQALAKLQQQNFSEDFLTGKNNIIIEKNAPLSIGNFDRLDQLFALAEKTCSPVYESEKHLLWLEKKQHLAPGPWEYAHIKKRVEKDALTARQTMVIRQKISHIKKSSEILDYFKQHPH